MLGQWDTVALTPQGLEHYGSVVLGSWGAKHPLPTNPFLSGLCEQGLPPCLKRAIKIHHFLSDLLLSTPGTSL